MEKEFIKKSIINFLLDKKDSYNNVYKFRNIIIMFNNISKNFIKYYSFHNISKILFELFLKLEDKLIIENKLIIILFCYTLENNENKCKNQIEKLTNYINNYCEEIVINELDTLLLNCINDFFLTNWNNDLQIFIKYLYEKYKLKNTESFIIKNIEKKEVINIKNKKVNLVKNKQSKLDINNFLKKENINKKNSINKRSNLKSYFNKFIIKKKIKKNNPSFINIDTNSIIINKYLEENDISKNNETNKSFGQLEKINTINSVSDFSKDWIKLNDIFNKK